MPPLVYLAAATLAAGLGCGVALDLAWASLAPVPVTVALLAAVLAHAHGRSVLCVAAAVLAACVLAAIYGAAAVGRALHPPLRTMLEREAGGFAIESDEVGRLDAPVMLEGRLVQDAIRTADGILLRLDIDRVGWRAPVRQTRAGVSLSVSGAMAGTVADAWTSGRRLRLAALLRRPATYRNPGLADRERALALRGTALVGRVKSAALVDVVARGTWWQEAAAGVRRRVREAIARWLTPRDPDAAAVALAILIGDRAGLGVDVERRLQEAGTYHVVAISGGNVAVFAGLVLGGLGLAGWRGRGAAAAGIAIILAYGFVAEGGASVTRATAIAVIYLGVRLIDMRTPPTQALALCAAGMLLVDPLKVADVGFWLTFGAAGAIVLVAGASRPPRRWWAALPIGLLLASLAVETVLLPVVALVFERVTLAGLVLNFLAVPGMTIVQLGSMVLVAADTLGLDWCADAAARLVEAGAWGLLASARGVEWMPWLTWRTPAPLPAVVGAYYMALGAWWWGGRQSTGRRRLLRRGAGWSALAFGAVVAVAPQTLLLKGDGTLHITLFDVGQGDAILVTLPNGRTLMVDAGGFAQSAFDVGDRILGPALRARGIRRLDYLAITHPDPDHIGGAPTLVRDFSPREVWIGVPVAKHTPSLELKRAAEQRHAAWRTLQRGDRWESGGVTLAVRHPPPPEWERQRVRNDDSLVLELLLGSVRVVLTGDIGRAVERELTFGAHSRLTILKVPHHGSATSSTDALLSALEPAVALIGVGRGNVYDHPVPAVLDRYRAVHTQVFRTDLDGAVELVTDGRSLWVWTFRAMAGH